VNWLATSFPTLPRWCHIRTMDRSPRHQNRPRTGFRLSYLSGHDDQSCISVLRIHPRSGRAVRHCVWYDLHSGGLNCRTGFYNEESTSNGCRPQRCVRGRYNIPGRVESPSERHIARNWLGNPHSWFHDARVHDPCLRRCQGKSPASKT